jgi:2-oxoglutarate ferredoxin oxidoreductase subunit alpha
LLKNNKERFVKEISVLIGGKAGFGIDTSSLLIARILSKLGFRLYIYRDYPSLIRGGHTFSIIRAAQEKICTHNNKIDILLALNQDTWDLHKYRLSEGSSVIYDSITTKIDGLSVTAQSIGIPFTGIIKDLNALEIMRNSCIIGAFCKAAGIGWNILEEVFKKNISKDTDLNLKVALRGYTESKELTKINALQKEALPLLTGNEAIGLGLIKGGLKTYISYPMTPSSGVLHFLANEADRFSLKVIHPENEIAVMLMALGGSYTGDKVAVGTSGGGFCLMTEGLSLSGMAELPVVAIVGQRPGPSTGLPTYSGQTELFFVLNAGQGEFTRVIAAPGDAEEAYFWAAISLNIAAKYQIPAIILTDKTLAEGTYSFDIGQAGEIQEENSLVWDRKNDYKRYLDTETGVSALAFPSDKEAVIKVNSYEHDEYGISIEGAALTNKMQEKRLRKEKYLSGELEKYETVKVYGNKDSSVALLCWGSNKGVCVEAALSLGLKVIQPVVLWPFPSEQFKKAINGVKTLISVENNAAGQLGLLLKLCGFKTNKEILRYDGRPFSLDELEARLKTEL